MAMLCLLAWQSCFRGVPELSDDGRDADTARQCDRAQSGGWSCAGQDVAVEVASSGFYDAEGPEDWLSYVEVKVPRGAARRHHSCGGCSRLTPQPLQGAPRCMATPSAAAHVSLRPFACATMPGMVLLSRGGLGG